MMLTPQAKRLIATAVRDLPNWADRETWRSWSDWTDRTGAAPLSSEVTPIVLRALAVAAEKLERQLRSNTLDDDDQADTLHDLGYVLAIKGDLEKERTVAAIRAGQ
jgi:hypothetical protein